MNEIYSIIDLIDPKLLVVSLVLLVLTNIFITFLVLVKKIKPSELASAKGNNHYSLEPLPEGQISSPSVLNGIPKSNAKKEQALGMPKLEAAIKLIKTSDISKFEIVDRLNIEPEYADILVKNHKK